MTLRAPFPWFGSKRLVSDDIWARLGNPKHYVEPFFGSGATLLQRPTGSRSDVSRVETVNDFDGFVANFWRAVKNDPEAVADAADAPVFENDLHAKSVTISIDGDGLLRGRLEADPDWFDAKIAGWWAWGQSMAIAARFGGRVAGPWQVVEQEDGSKSFESVGDGGPGIARSLPSMRAQGVNKLSARGITRCIPAMCPQGVLKRTERGRLLEWFRELAERFRYVRVTCGDWSRVCSNSALYTSGVPVGILLDPPYAAEGIDEVYDNDSTTIAHDVREFALKEGEDPRTRIALCGYVDEHGPHMPKTWEEFHWAASGGYGNASKNHDNPNSRRERIWFSPHCLRVATQGELF